LGIELKVWRTRKVDPLSKGLEQLDGYLARLGQDSGWLVIFDRRDNAPELEERLKTKIHTTSMGARLQSFVPDEVSITETFCLFREIEVLGRPTVCLYINTSDSFSIAQ
jgi:hypothetical protein